MQQKGQHAMTIGIKHPVKRDTSLIPLAKTFVRVGAVKIYFKQNGELKGPSFHHPNGEGLVIVPNDGRHGPQRNPLARLSTIIDNVKNHDDELFLPGEVTKVGKGSDAEFDATDCGGRCLHGLLLGYTHIYAYVGAEIPEEARAAKFGRFNAATVPLSQSELLHGKIGEGRVKERRIMEALHPNYKIYKSGKNAISSVAALYDIYEWGGKQTPVSGSDNTTRGSDWRAGCAILTRIAQVAGAAYLPKYEKQKNGKYKLRKDRKGAKVEGRFAVSMALFFQELPTDTNKVCEEAYRDIFKENTPAEIKKTVSDNNLSLAEKAKSASLTKRLKMLTQDLAVPMAEWIAGEYNRRIKLLKYSGGKSYPPVDIDAIGETELAKAYSGRASIKK